MDCDKYLELMSAALDGECTAEERRQLDSHLAVCPDCAELFRTLSANANAMRELDCEVPADLKARIMSDLPEQEKPIKKSKVIHWKRWAPVAAAACLALVVALVPKAGNVSMNTAQAPTADAPRAPVPSTTAESDAAGSVEQYSMGGYTADPAEPATQPTYGGAFDNSASALMTPQAGSTDTDGSSTYETGEPAHYSFENQQAIRVHYGATPEPGAEIVGSAESLENYLAQFASLSWDGEGNTVPIAELEALAETYTEEFFQTHRLLCVVVESGSGSNRYEIASQGLLRDSVTVLAHIPEVGTCDMAAWLLVAEVDTMFDDGDVLEVIYTR